MLSDEPIDWLEDCADHATQTFWHDDASASGKRVGAYTLIHEIGRGGMGTVYLAARADGAFEKQVAIKILKRGTDSTEVLRRFHAERQILAGLDHPNIARLLDAGTTEDGLPYFVMEYVEGLTVTRFVREHRLEIKERLELFLKICGAVGKAHTRRVIHRDLKPSNILVDEDGEPKLLDFGIAKLLSPDELGADITGGHLLSPACASPEQARGEPMTAATDIYALGTLLFEMLAGRAAHRFTNKIPSVNELARVICEEQPPAPSVAALDAATAEQLRGDLDAIVLRAIQKDPAARYPSVTELTADIRQFLIGQRVLLDRRNSRGEAVGRKQTAPGRIRLLQVAAVVAAGGTIALWLTFRPKADDPPGAPPAGAGFGEKSIAVLPFRNLSTAPENAFFASGVQDAILTDLAKIADLKVINRTSVQQYASHAPRDLQEISKQLRVAYVLEGSVQRSENRVRVTASLTDARTSAQLWAEHYDRELADVFVIQSDIAGHIAMQLRVKLSPAEKAAVHTESTRDLAAYDLYLRAQERERGLTRVTDDLDAQVRLLDEAVARDPQFVPALCLLARIHVRSYFLNIDPSAARLELAKRAVAAATEVAPEAGEVHLAQATLFYWGHRDYASALDRLALARRSLPNEANIPFITGLIKRRQGHWEESTKHFREAASLDPRNANVLFELATTYTALKRYREAADVFDGLLLWNRGEFLFKYARATVELKWKADTRRLREVLTPETAADRSPELLQRTRLNVALLERDYQAAQAALSAYWQPDVRSPDYVIPREFFEGVIGQGLGDAEKAQNSFEAARDAAARMADEHPEDGKALMVLAQIDARLGHAEAARRQGEHAVRLLSVTDDALAGALMLVELAKIHARVGDTDRALDLIEQAAKLPYGVDYGSLKLDEAWDPLRNEARFAKLVGSLAPR